MSRPDVRGIKVIIYDSQANLCEVDFRLDSRTVTKNGIDIHALEAALQAVEAAQTHLIKVSEYEYKEHEDE